MGETERTENTPADSEGGPPERALAVVAPLLGLGAIALYAVGVLSTAGKLRAADVPIAPTFGLAPLQQHLVNGLGLLLEPRSLALLGFFGTVGAVTFTLFAVINRDDGGDDTGPVDYRGLWPGAVGMGFLMLLAAFLAPWYLLILPFATVVALLVLRVVRNHFPEFFARRKGLLYPGALMVLFALQLATGAYFDSAPPPKAEVTTEEGVVRGTVVARDGQYLFLNVDGRRAYIAIPAAEIKRYVVDQPPPNDKDDSFYRSIGLPFGL